MNTIIQKSQSSKSSEKKTKSHPLVRDIHLRPPTVRKLTSKSKVLHEHIRKSLIPLDEEEVKGVRLRNEVKFRPSGDIDTGMVSSLFNPNEVYTFKLQGFSTVSSNGSGIIAVSVPFDPSSGGFNFSEWTDLAALFDEVRLHSFRVQICSYVNTTVTLVFSPLIIGTNLISSSAPGSEGAVAMLTDAHYHPSSITNGVGFVTQFNNRGEIGWSTTTSVSDLPYAGCPGSFWIYVANFSVSTLAFKVLVSGTYEFRARA